MEELGAARSLLDEQLNVLSHVERRQLLMALLEENPQAVEPVDDERRADVEHRNFLIEMHHRHLPKLEGEGFVRWDRERDVVTKGPQFEEIRPLVELLDAHRNQPPADGM